MSSDLQEGLRLVTEAVKEDSNGNLEGAVQLYEKSLALFEKASLVEQGPMKGTIQQKMKEYQSRCDILKEKLEKKDLAQRMAKLGVGTLPSQRVGNEPTKGNKTSTKAPESEAPLQFQIPEYVEEVPHTPVMIHHPVTPQPISPIPPPQQAPPIIVNHQVPQYEYTTEPTMTLSMEPPKTYVSAPSLSSIRPADLMTKNEALQTASELSIRATEEDQANRFAEALATYEKSLDYFMRVLKEETDPGIRNSLSVTMRRYLERAEQLKHMVSFANTTGIGTELKQCDFCRKPIGITEDFKVSSEQKLYHLKCFEGVVGLEREETRKFLTGGSMTLKVSISKRIIKMGGEITFSAHVENKSTKKINCIVAYLLKTETTMHVTTTKSGVERKAKTKTDKLASRDFYGVNSLFPMESGTADLKAAFPIPSDIQATELSTTANYSREYDLIIKCDLSGPHEDLKVAFPLRIEQK